MQYTRVFEGAYSLHYAESKVKANFYSPYVLGGEYKNCIFIGKEGRLAGYYSSSEMSALRLVSYALLMNRGYSEKLIHDTVQSCKKIITSTKKLMKIDFSLAKPDSLAKYFRQYRDLHFENQAYFVSSMPTCTSLLECRLNEFLDSKINDKRSRQETLVILTSPDGKTHLDNFEEDLLKVSINHYDDIVHGYADKISKMIGLLISKYGWLPTQERNPPYDYNYIWLRLKELSKRSRQELVFILENLQLRPKKLANSRRKIEDQLDIKDDIRYISALIRDLAYWRMNVRLARTYSDYLGKKLLHEIANRFGIEDYHVEYLTVEEIESLLAREKQPNINDIKERLELYVYIIENGVSHIITGEHAKFVKHAIEKNDRQKYEKIIKGLPASPGKVKGHVKIISPLSNNQLKDCALMKKGEILVTGQTRPQLMLAVNKAKAIVTDEGGLTSHSAVVSREFGIPCIVGTKNATKLLNTGDLIEVDAYKGIVKILRKNKC